MENGNGPPLIEPIGRVPQHCPDPDCGGVLSLNQGDIDEWDVLETCCQSCKKRRHVYADGPDEAPWSEVVWGEVQSDARPRRAG
jgi:hypothetical protein